MKKVMSVCILIILTSWLFGGVENKEVNKTEVIITIDADKIAADGEDYATINTNDKEWKSDKIEVFCNNIKMNNRKFTTTTAGMYLFYAKVGEIKSTVVTLSALSLEGLKWRTVNEKFVSKSIMDNKIGYDGKKDINVCLPPAYDISSSSRKFPVVYFLAGYGEDSKYDMTMFKFKTTINRAFANGKTRNIVYVFLNGQHKLGGSFYVNSAMGKWEDYVCKDVIAVVEGKYRVKTEAASRGIGGHSMGGYGALNIAVKHPDIFGAVYCTSPGLVDPTTPTTTNGIENLFLQQSERATRINAYTSIKMKYENDTVGFTTSCGALFKDWTWEGVDTTYGMAFSQDEKPPYFKYPFTVVGGNIVKDQTIYDEWNMGYGGIAAGVKTNNTNWKKLAGIRIDYGNNDEFQFIVAGANYLDKILKEEGIEATIQGNEGNHEDSTHIWAENYMYPFFSEKLK